MIESCIYWDMDGAAVEAESFARIEAETPETARGPEAEWRVTRRMIHACGDVGLAGTVTFRNDPVSAGLEALRRGSPVFCDSNMIRAGISVARLQKLHASYSRESLVCLIADPDVAERARREGRTRALCAVEKARPLLDGAVLLVGNAPLALARAARYILEEGLRPALVIGVPVGFVNVVESKELLSRCPVPQIVLEGRRGGSALAVAALHGILESA